MVTATFWPTYPPDHWDTPGIRVALGTDGLLTVPPEATNRPTQTGRVVFEGLADNEKIISADVRYTVRDHAPTGGTESTATPSLLEQLLTQTGSNAQVAAQSADAAAKSASAAAAHAAAAAGPGQRARRLPSFLFLPAQLPLAGAEAGADVLDEPLAAPDDAVWFCMRLSSSGAVSKALAIWGSLSTV